MRYNNYRQYVSLSGVKRENKLNVIENLNAYTKNVMSIIPKAEFEKIKSRDRTMFLEIIVKPDNSVQSIILNAFDYQDDEEGTHLKIPIPKLCYIQDFDDGTDSVRRINVEYYNKQNQIMTFDAYAISHELKQDDVQTFEAEYLSPLWSKGNWYHQQFSYSNVEWVTEVSRNQLDHVRIILRLTDFEYADLPKINITYFE